MSVDLHIHSWHSSDSLISPAEIVDLAVHMGLSAVAITDHDTVAGLAEAQAAAADAAERGVKVEVVPAAELTARFPPTGEALHVLGLLVDPAHPELIKYMARSRVAERRNFRLVVEGLAERGLDISETIVRQSFEAEHPGVPWDEPRYFYLYSYLVAAGAASGESSAKSILQRVIAGKHGKIHEAPPAREAIAAVKAAGGVAVLAHPVHYSWAAGEEARRILKRMGRFGLDGIEALHKSHSLEDRARWAAMARQLGMVISGGSDSHDPRTDPVFGRMGVPDAVLAEMKRRLRR